ncbi:hypothetical protein STEG23_025607 [Scotinomys teguina]
MGGRGMLNTQRSCSGREEERREEKGREEKRREEGGREKREEEGREERKGEERREEKIMERSCAQALLKVVDTKTDLRGWQMVTQKSLDHSIQMIIDCLLLAHRTAVKAYRFCFSSLQNRVLPILTFLNSLHRQADVDNGGHSLKSPVKTRQTAYAYLAHDTALSHDNESNATTD